MKNNFLTLLALAAGLSLLAPAPVSAQTFANSSFDTWAIRNGVEAPTNWQTTDDIVASQLGLRLPTGTVSKTAVVRSGAFACELQTKNLALANVDLPGVVSLGNSLSGGADLPGGLPFTGRPRSLQCYYQLSGSRAIADSAEVIVQLTRQINGSPTVVAELRYYFQTLASNYTLVTVPLRYLSGLTPDSVSVGISSGSSNVLTPGTTLRIDDISFTGTAPTATRDVALATAISVAPNPSPDGRFQLGATEPALLACPLSVLDATGRTVRHEETTAATAATRPLDLSSLPGGIYTVQLFTPRGLVTRKLVR